MSLKKLIFFFMVMALITGSLSMRGFFIASSVLYLSQILFPIFMFIFIIMVIKYFLKRNNNNL